MSPQLSLRERDVFGLGAGVCIEAVVEAWHLGDVGVELLYTTYELMHIDVLGLLNSLSAMDGHDRPLKN
jgi:hypothetical protein